MTNPIAVSDESRRLVEEFNFAITGDDHFHRKAALLAHIASIEAARDHAGRMEGAAFTSLGRAETTFAKLNTEIARLQSEVDRLTTHNERMRKIVEAADDFRLVMDWDGQAGLNHDRQMAYNRLKESLYAAALAALSSPTTEPKND